MARPRSEEKRSILLASATEVFAHKGLSAPTSAITAAAGLAEGTLFVYFKNKDELINILYAEIKQSLVDILLGDFPSNASIRERTRHLWNGFIRFAIEHPHSAAALDKIRVYEGLRPEIRENLAAKFCEINTLTQEGIDSGVLADIPTEFMFATLTSQAETTIQFMRQVPEQADFYREKGFEIFWNGISKH